MPGIGADDKVILWGGGIYNWFDPLTLLRAVDKLRGRVPERAAVLPRAEAPEPERARDAHGGARPGALADELGLTDTHVFFNEGWVAYDDRQNYLLEADIGVSTHLDHVETEFSFRTRILDYLWASLPVVATGGDSFARHHRRARHRAHRARRATSTRSRPRCSGCSTTTTLAAAVPRRRPAGWPTSTAGRRVLEPLIEFCRAPRRAPDLVDPDMAAAIPSISGHRRGAPAPSCSRSPGSCATATSARIVRKTGGRVKRALAAGR